MQLTTLQNYINNYFSTRFAFTACLFLFLAPLNQSYSQDEDPWNAVGGRWIPAGTFALSNFENNDLRERSYSGARKEKSRLATYLPSMTIVYQSEPSKLPERTNYVEGLTHSGISVAVLESDLSTGKFSDRSTRDVVVHLDHYACRNLACSGDEVPIGIGYSFSIKEEDSDSIDLANSNELKITYAIDKFNKLERRGVLTRHKDRSHPRWIISDGYASEISVQCSETKKSGYEINVPADVFDGDPATWKQNDSAWSLKAIQLFGLGTVELDEQNNQYTGGLAYDIKNPESEDEKIAIDFTIFGYRDSSWTPERFKFAGIIQKVKCDKTALGGMRPSYVKDAYLYIDKQQGVEQTQVFPLSEVELPRQFSKDVQKELFNLLGRSFFYSINGPEAYKKVFKQLSNAGIPFPIASANVIARLNASCRESDRTQCNKIASND